MRNRCFVLLFSCLLTAGGSAQQPSQTSPGSAPPAGQSTTPQQSKKSDKIPTGTTAEKAANAVKPPDYTEESFVIEQMHSNYRFEADGTGRKETKARIRVQSEAGVQQWGQLLEGYNSANERVEIPYVRVLKEDGSVVKAGDDAVQDLSAPIEREAPVYTDYRQKHITVPGLRPGEVLEYDMVTVIHTPLAAGQFWAEYEFDKSNISIVIANPDFALDNRATPNLLLHTRREAFPYQDDWLAWHLVRLLSVVMGAVTVWATWQIAATIFPEGHYIALGAAAFVAFLPEFVFLSGAVNNDNLIIMLSALSVLQILRTMQRPVRLREAVWLGVLFGMALLTKLSGAVLWVFGAGAFFWIARQEGEWKNVARALVICFAVALVLAAPWLIYNIHKNGDPFAWSLYLKVGTIRQTPITLADWTGIAQGVFTSFWGRFGGALQIHMANVVYAAFGAVASLALLGWLGYARDARRGELATGVRTIFIACVAMTLLISAAYVSWAVNDRGAGQVRQLFPAVPLVAIFLASGWARLFASRQNWALLGWSVGFAAWSVIVLIYVSSLYRAPTYTEAAARAFGGDSAAVDFGPSALRMLSSRVEPMRVAPGDSVSVAIYWQSLEPTREDYWLLLQLMDASDAVAHQEGVPSAGRVTTDWWQPGQIYFSQHTLVVPQDVAPGSYTLTLGLRPFPRYDWLRVGGKEMFTLGTVDVSPKP